MKNNFAATLLLGSAIATLTREQKADIQKSQMHSCVNKVDFLDKDSFRQIENCANHAKQAILRNKADFKYNPGHGSQLVPSQNISGAPHPVALPIYTVKDRCCLFYDGIMSGASIELCHEGEVAQFNILDYFNDRIESWSCGAEVILKVCKHMCENAPNDQFQTMAGKNSHNLHLPEQTYHEFLMNQISDIILAPYDEELVGAVTLYCYTECRGTTGVLLYMDQEGGGQYSDQDLFDSGLGFIWSNGVRYHSLNSLNVPAGYEVTIFEGWALDGYSETYSNPAYGNSAECITLDHFPGNNWHSLRIDRIPHVHAIGYWKAITSGESTSFTYTVGITSSSSSEVTRSNSHEFTASLTAGIEFGGFGGISATLSNTSSASETQAVMQQYGMSTELVTSTTCTAEGNEGAGLWQWVVATEDYSYQAFSSNTVCRTGELYNKSPECPWFACIGGDCHDCYPRDTWAN